MKKEFVILEGNIRIKRSDDHSHVCVCVHVIVHMVVYCASRSFLVHILNCVLEFTQTHIV